MVKSERVEGKRQAEREMEEEEVEEEKEVKEEKDGIQNSKKTVDFMQDRICGMSIITINAIPVAEDVIPTIVLITTTAISTTTTT